MLTASQVSDCTSHEVLHSLQFVNDGCASSIQKSIAIIQLAINHRASYGLGGDIRYVISNVTHFTVKHSSYTNATINIMSQPHCLLPMNQSSVLSQGWLFNGTLTQKSKFVPTAGEGNRLSRLRMDHEIQCIISHVTQQQCNTVCSKTLQLHKRKDRLSNRWHTCLWIR